MEGAATILTFWTEAATRSKAVIEEASTAQAAGKLVHARLDDAPLPYGFGETQYANLQDWDGTATHPQFRRLMQALQDKLTPPTHDALAERLNAASPIAYIARSGRLSPVDTPPNTAPPVQNPEDLTARLAGLDQSVERILGVIANRDTYQIAQ